MTTDIERLEALRLQLCAVGLHPRYHDTPEKAAQAVVEMIEQFRRDANDPPHHMQCAVLRRLGVEGYTEQDQPTCRLIQIQS